MGRGGSPVPVPVPFPLLAAGAFFRAGQAPAVPGDPRREGVGIEWIGKQGSRWRGGVLKSSSSQSGRKAEVSRLQGPGSMGRIRSRSRMQAERAAAGADPGCRGERPNPISPRCFLSLWVHFPGGSPGNNVNREIELLPLPPPSQRGYSAQADPICSSFPRLFIRGWKWRGRGRVLCPLGALFFLLSLSRCRGRLQLP